MSSRAMVTAVWVAAIAAGESISWAGMSTPVAISTMAATAAPAPEAYRKARYSSRDGRVAVRWREASWTTPSA